MTDTAYVHALQEALAGEHAAVYAYGVIGGRLKAATRPQVNAGTSYRLHRTRRDSLISMIHAAGRTPVAAEPGYALSRDVADATSASRLAGEVERRCAVLYAAVIAVAPPPRRIFSLHALISCATQELIWGQAPSSFPGVRP